MPRSLSRALLLAFAVAAALVVAACGGGSKKSSSSSSGTGTSTSQGQHKGGTLQVISNSDFDHLDPGAAYYQLTYEWLFAADRPLYSYKPDQPAKPVPDLAASDPVISADKKTVTVHLRHGVMFSPPVSREVTAQDVKYAMSRTFWPNIAGGYAGQYYGDLVGASTAGKKIGYLIPGIETPDKYTLVFKLTKPNGATLAAALVMPATIPVPPEYAKKWDTGNPSHYDVHQVSDGPYMIQMVGGKVNYVPGKKLVLVRNPNWHGSSQGDYRPAYVDQINWTIGTDPTVMGRQVLGGRDAVNGDTPPAPIVKQAYTTRKSDINFTGGQGNRYIALNTAIAPFNNANLRKAVYAAMDRKALQLTRGGALTGDIATHFIPPGMPGFEEAGGMKGPDLDFNRSLTGDMTVAKKYLAAAGFKNGRYSGPPILMVADNTDPAAKTAQVVLQTFQKLGFNVKFRSVSHDTMYTNFCNVPKKNVQVCPNVGWIKDFNDPVALLKVPFYGPAITPVNNSNWPQLNDPAINAAMVKAGTLTGEARLKAWGKIDDDITATAAAIPWFWDKQPNIKSTNVKGVIAQWNASWDLAFTSVR